VLVASEFFFITSKFFHAIQSNILRTGGVFMNIY